MKPPEFHLNGLAFDIDGVIADVMAPIRGRCESILGHPYNHAKETGHDLTGALGLEDSPEVVAPYINYCLHLLDNIPIDPYAVKLTTALYEATETAIPFVTHRHRDPMMDVTYKLIESFIEVPYTVAFAGGTSSQVHQKARYIPEGYGFVEDRRAIAVELAEEGICCWLIRTPYNKLDRTQQSSNIVPVDSLKDIYNYYFGDLEVR